MRSRIAATFIISVLAFSSLLIAQEQEPYAPLLENLGDHTHKVTTNNPQAQEYFDQGLILHYGFNHAEAVRSFRQAQRLDPQCAMAYWGEALSLGPHINSAMSAPAAEIARESIQKAQQLAGMVSQKEEDYINALAARYQGSAQSRRSHNFEYVDAMRKLAAKYPDDADAQALFAEALMITTAWDYWQANGKPNQTGAEIIETLENSMQKEPYHPGTNHFYIHTVETHHPEMGIDAADRIRGLVPGVGHLTHMPSHIYLQIGRFADATDVNQDAVDADRRYLDRHGAHGMYRISYIPHNSIYLCFSASMEGWGAKTLEAANITRDLILEKQLYQPGYGSLTMGYSLRYVAMARFGMWDEMLAQPRPPQELLYPTAVWHYARGMAFLRTGQADSANHELSQLNDMINDGSIAQMDAWGANTTRKVLNIASNMLAGEIEAASQNYDRAIDHLRRAVSFEDNLGYYEPPPWFIPARQTLGAILLEAGNPSEAEQVYRRDLDEWPDNGWSLFGLYHSLDQQGKQSEAEDVHRKFNEAWSRADIELTSSRM